MADNAPEKPAVKVPSKVLGTVIKMAAGGPAERYVQLCDSGRLEPDPSQQAIVAMLDQRFSELTQKRNRWPRRRAVVRGLYIHGQVGRGKTLLMDLFAQSLKDAGVEVERSHFHRFMDQVHHQLKALSGQTNPLEQLADDLADRTHVLCFDEFHVDDIADAMLLGELTRHWFEHGLTFVTTSNTAPPDLYADGLQRQRFLPAIENIQAHCDVVKLNAPQDFRLRELQRYPTWHQPFSESTEDQLADEFKALCPSAQSSEEPITLRGRSLNIRARASSVLWAHFSDLCEQPRSAGDYVEMTRRFSTLLLSEIPRMDDDDNNAAKRFVHLVDECYDRSVKLIASAAAPIDAIYSGSRLAKPFERTVSRLIEMQSHEYLARPHRR